MALTQIVTTDSVSASVVNTKIVDPANTAITGLQIAQTAGGTATAITLTGIELTNGYQKTFIISASNSGSATTVNGKPLYKPGGTVAPNLTAGKAASIWYNLTGDCFFYKASAEGAAVVGDVLAGKTFSNDNDTGLTGTMVNRGAVTITPSTTNQTIANGYHNGSGYVLGDADLIAKNILSGKNIFGVNGSAKRSATGLLTNGTDGIIRITGLDFTPNYVIAYRVTTPYNYYAVAFNVGGTIYGATIYSSYYQFAQSFGVGYANIQVALTSENGGWQYEYRWYAFE